MLRELVKRGCVLFPLLTASACVSEGDAAGAHATAPNQSAAAAAIETQPRQAIYQCGNSGRLGVENLRTTVVLTDPQGEIITLPAAPTAQQTRYGMPGYALVLEGDEALYMKGGKEPLTCRR